MNEQFQMIPLPAGSRWFKMVWSDTIGAPVEQGTTHCALAIRVAEVFDEQGNVREVTAVLLEDGRWIEIDQFGVVRTPPA